MTLLEKIRNNLPVYGTCITSYNPLWPAALEKTGLDFVFVDTEHIALDRSQVAHMCQQYAGRGLAPIVRIPKPDPFLACQMIDAGAKGVVAPYLEHEGEILDLVGATKFRPLKGKKLREILTGREETIKYSLKQYIDRYNEGNICIANIESVPAMERLDHLLTVKGLDAVFIGPHDLSVSMGIPEEYDHPHFEEAVSQIVDKCLANRLGVGIHFSGHPTRQVYWMKKGVNIIIHSSDYALFNQRLRGDLHFIKKEMGEDSTPAQDDSQVV